MKNPLIFIGGGEHAKVVYDSALSMGCWDIIGVIDPNPQAKCCADLSLPWLGNDDAFVDIVCDFKIVFLILGFGTLGPSPKRMDMIRLFSSIKNVQWATIIHSSAVISPFSKVGDGTVVFPKTVINSGTIIGKHCILNTGSIIEHDVIIEDYSQLAPGSVIGGGTALGENSYIGLGAHIRDHVVIGDNCCIGMGAVVLNDVPSNLTVYGNPARIKG